MIFKRDRKRGTFITSISRTDGAVFRVDSVSEDRICWHQVGKCRNRGECGIGWKYWKVFPKIKGELLDI